MSDFVNIGADLYNNKFYGMYGEFGAAANSKVRYLQIVLQPTELSSIDLISDIKGSEKWPVRDLFQRNVDIDRVSEEIIPYLENTNVVKFFNPITLIALPIDKSTNSVIRELPKLKESIQTDENIKTWIEKENYFKLGKLNPTQGIFKWNSINTKIVAIDGQHRLTALKQLLEKPVSSADIHNWVIPAVLIIIEKESDEKPSADLLELVRNTFVYINTQAVVVNDARKILLNDELPSSVFTQEFIQNLHENDILDYSERDTSLVPLLLIDWRGDTANGRRVESPASVFLLEEIRDWIEYYLLGEDFSEAQKIELDYDDFLPPLKTYGKDKLLNSTDSQKIRKRFKDSILPGIIKFFTGLDPFTEYIRQIRGLEEQYESQSTYFQHAFNKLRFGYSDHNRNINEQVTQAYHDLVDEITSLKSTLDPLLQKDVGRRAVFYALGKLKQDLVDYYIHKDGRRLNWLQTVEILLPHFNKIIEDGWFDVDNSSPEVTLDYDKYETLEMIVFDINLNIINYRLQDSEGGFGSLLRLLIAKELLDNDQLSQVIINNIWSDERISLAKTIEREAKKLHRAQLKSTFKGTQDQLMSEISRRASETKDEKLDAIKLKIGL